MARDIPRRYQALYKRRKRSRKSAIRSQCLECVGYVAKEVELCTDPGCPLFSWRLIDAEGKQRQAAK
jgi:hypothetical protein